MTHPETRPSVIPLPLSPAPRDFGTLIGGLLGAAALILVAGLFLNPVRIWPNFLITLLFVAYVGLAGIFFVALQYVTKAGWSVVIRRVAEACAQALIPAALLAPLLFFGVSTLYEWSRPEVVAHDAVLQAKAVWLNTPFFMGRTLAVFLIWLGFTALLLRNSRAQDTRSDRGPTDANVRIGAAFCVVFGITVTLTGFDWLMSLEPHWYSTIFGAYCFAGLFQSGIATILLVVLFLRRAGYYRRERYPELSVHGVHVVSEHHLHDLGKLLFAFSCFWAYLWFCQYMLIWYANIPEETFYYTRRQVGGWGTLFVLNLVVNWVVPFFALISKHSKRNTTILMATAGAVLFGRWLDLYIMVMPVFRAEPGLDLWDLFTPLAVTGLLLATILHALRSAPLVPPRDPYLAESLHHHV